MRQNRLFNRTRLQLAALYAAVMGIILGMGGWALHEMLLRLFWQSLDQELVTLTGTLHDGLEGVLQQPGVLNPEAVGFLPGLCLPETSCTKATLYPRHTLGLVQQQDYYVRFVSLQGKLLGSVGEQPPGLAVVAQPGHLREIQDLRGYRYHQISGSHII